MIEPSLVEEAFALLQKDGKIPKVSIPTALRAAGLNPSESKIKQIMSSTADLDMPSYKKLLEECDDKTDTAEAVREAFRIFDKDSNGVISVAEFRHIMTTMGDKYDEEEFRNLIQGVESDGVIYYDSLIERMLAPFTDHLPQQ